MKSIFIVTLFLTLTGSSYSFGFLTHPLKNLFRRNPPRSFDRNLCVEKPMNIYGSFPFFRVSAGEIHTFYYNPIKPRSLAAAHLNRKRITMRILRFDSQPASIREEGTIHRLRVCIPNEAFLLPSYQEDKFPQIQSNRLSSKQL
ncbi:hypothetical protein HOF92_11430 [bacterium]|jgi:hypothetical protein|nr:hypothetical protein [bacterium]